VDQKKRERVVQEVDRKVGQDLEVDQKVGDRF